MSWLRIEGRMPHHRKVAPLSDAAFRLHITAQAWCVEEESDGNIPSGIPATLPAAPRGKKLEKVLRELIDARLWDVVGDGYAIHDFLQYNLSAAEAQDLREKKKAAGAKGGHKRAENRGADPSKCLAGAKADAKHLLEHEPSKCLASAQAKPKQTASSGQADAQANSKQNSSPTPIPNPDLILPATATQGPDRSETHVRPTAAAAGEKPPKQLPDVAVPCPQDLGLLPEQRGALEMSAGIPAWAIDQLRNDFVFAELGRPDKRMTVERWRVCLSKAITSQWSNPSRRPKKPEPEYDPRKANEPSPAQRAFERRIEEERRAKHAAIHAERLAAGKVTGTDMAEVIAIATGGARG